MEKLIILFSVLLLANANAENPKCPKNLELVGFSTELRSYKMDLSFCRAKKSSREVVTHVNYLNKETKTVYLTKKKHLTLIKAIERTANEIEKEKTLPPQQCSHSTTATILVKGARKKYSLCEKSKNHLYSRKLREIIREAYYSKEK